MAAPLLLLRFPLMPAPDPEVLFCERFPSSRVRLRPGDLLTVMLPDGQSVDIDVYDPAAVVVHHVDSAGDGVALMDGAPEPEPDGPHPSLSAAERNPSLC